MSNNMRPKNRKTAQLTTRSQRFRLIAPGTEAPYDTCHHRRTADRVAASRPGPRYRWPVEAPPPAPSQPRPTSSGSIRKGRLIVLRKLREYRLTRLTWRNPSPHTLEGPSSLVVDSNLVNPYARSSGQNNWCQIVGRERSIGRRSESLILAGLPKIDDHDLDWHGDFQDVTDSRQ